MSAYPYNRWYDWPIALAFGLGFSLLCGYLDSPVEAPVCGTDTECEATLGADEADSVYYEDLHREAKARK